MKTVSTNKIKVNVYVILASILYGIAVVWTNSVHPDVILTPLLGLWWLLVAALYRPPQEVAIMALMLLLFSIFSILHERHHAIYVRITSFCVSSALAILLAQQRIKFQTVRSKMTHIIESLPVAIVAANRRGTIIAASDNAKLLAGENFQPLIGHVFADVFIGSMLPAAAFQEFEKWAEQGVPSRKSFAVRGQSGNEITGRIQYSGEGKSRLIIVIFDT